MPKNKKSNFGYLLVVTLLLVVLPVWSIIMESCLRPGRSGLWDLTGKWFVFWAVGIRLLMAGFRQTFQPAFTAQEIFRIKDKASFAIVKELGFANLCTGLAGVLTLWLPAWLVPTAFIGGLYYGLAGIGHLTKKVDSPNEMIALYSDLFIFLVVMAFVVHSFFNR
jgi:hypothetical protein